MSEFTMVAEKGRQPKLLAYVVASTSRPGELSLRLKPGDATWTPFIEALRAAGFKPGDVITIGWFAERLVAE